MAQIVKYSALLIGIWGGACTFYTDCPTAPAAGTGGSGTPTAGSGNVSGGSAGTGGTNGEAGDGSGGGPVFGGEIPEAEWLNVTGDLAGLPSECGNMHFFSSKPGEDMLIAGIAGNGLWASTDGGESWDKLGGDEADDVRIINRPTGIVYDPEDPDTFWESGIYNGGGVFRTRDKGESFRQLGTVTHNDSVSVDFSDPDRRTLLASGHEQGLVLFKSSDGGSNWEPIGSNLPERAGVCSFHLIIDADTYLAGCAPYGENVGGIFRTTDGGDDWALVSEYKGVGAALTASDGNIYWAGQGGMIKSDDQGRTWDRVTDGGLVDIHPVELPDGRIAALTPEYVVVSADQGETWRFASAKFPFVPAGLAYSEFQNSFYVWHNRCDPSDVPDDAIMAFPFDYETDAL